MPAPASVDELLDLIQKSGVADEARLKSYVQQLTAQGAVPPEPSKLAGQLVRDGLLTYFQAEQILQGKWKRFTIGKYRVLERIGAGGMGQVFLCEHKMMRRRVAVKVLPTAKAEDQASLDRFVREARAVAAVDHPNIVRAYDLDQDDNLHFLVMEYVDGSNLQDLVKKSGPLDPVRACHYVYGSAVGLQHAHSVGLIHRDIKPGNILIDRAGVVKILDMGLARFFHDTEDVLTKKYDESILGTADYLAPEQAEDSHTVDIRADIYSLGATFYYLLTGQPPFPEGTIPQKLFAHKSRDPKPVRAVRPEVPEGVAAVVATMMAKDPAKRFQTPAEVMEALAPWVATPIPPPDDREMPQLSPAAASAGGASIRIAATAPRTLSPVALTTPPGAAGPAAPTAGGAGFPTPTGLTAAPAGPAAGNAIWEALASETANNTHADTGRAPAPDEDRPAPVPRRRAPWVLIGGGLAALAAAAAGLYVFVLRPPPAAPTAAAPTAPGRSGPRQLTVSKVQAGDGIFPSLGKALAVAESGDTVVVREEKLSEGPLRVGGSRHKNVTIESGLPEGRAAVVEFVPPSSGSSAALVMLDVSHADGLRVRGIEFDGRDQADVGLNVNGVAPGLQFDGVTVRRVRQAAVRLNGAAGEPGRPVAVERGRFVLSKGAVGVEVTAPSPKLVGRHLLVRDCRFEGPGKAALRVETAVADLEFDGNRVYQSDAGVTFAGRVPDDAPVKAQVTGNTFHSVRVGLLFELWAGAKGRYEVAAARNYFARCGAVARTTGSPPAPPGFTSADNARDRATKDGNVSVPVTVVDDYELPNPNPADDDTFLRSPPDSPLATVGPKKVQVGAAPR